MQKICVVILLSALLSHYEAVPQTKWSRPIRNTQGHLTRERRQFSFGEWVPLSHPCPTCRHFADPLDSGLNTEKIGLTPPRPPTVTRQIHGEANFFPDESSILSVPPPPPSAIPRHPNGNFQFSSFGTQFNNPLPTQQIFPQTQQVQFLPQSFLPNQQVLVNNQQILPGLNQQQNNVFGQEQSKQQVNTGKIINFNNNFKSQKIPQNVVLEQNNRPVGPKQTFSNKPQPFAPQQQNQQQSFVQQQSIINQPQHSFAFGSSILTPPPAPNNSQNIVIPGLDKEEIQLLYVPVETLRQRGTFQQQQLINQDSQNIQFQNRPNSSQKPLNNIRATEQSPTTAAKGHFVTQNRNNVGQTISTHQVTTPRPFSSTASPSTVLFQNIPFQQTPQPFVSATPITPTIQPFVTPSSAGQTFSSFTPETTLPQLSTLPNAIQFSPQDIEFGTTAKTILSQGAFQGDIVNGKSQFSAFKSTPFVNQEQPKPTQQTFSNQQNRASSQFQQGAFFQEQKQINGQNTFSQQTDPQQVYLERQQDQQQLLREQEEKERQRKLRQQKELEAQRALQSQKELEEQRYLEQQRKQKELEAQRLQQRQKELEEQRFLDLQRKQKEQKEQLLLQQQRQKELEQQRYLQQQKQKELEQQRILLEQEKELEAERRLQLQRQKELEEKRRLQQLKQKQEEEQQRLLRIQQQQQQQQQQQREEQEKQKLLQKQQEQQRLLLQQKLQKEREENIRKQQQIQYFQQQKQQKQIPQQQVFQQTNRHVLPANDNLNLIPQLEKEGELESIQLVPHQPPLSVFYRGPQKAESQIVDVLRELRSSKTIIVLDQYFDKMPKVFVGPAGLIPPNGYRKFDLPYLSNLETNTIQKRIDKLPFFVAPVNFVPPPGYAKILFPAPHVGSVVVSNESNPAMTLGLPVKDATVSSAEEENDGSFPMVGPELPGLINRLETETTTIKPVTFVSTPSLPQTTAQLRNKRPNNSIYKPQNRKPISRTRVQTTTSKPEEISVSFPRTENNKESEGIRKPFNRFLHRRRQQTTTESSLKAQGGKSLENRHYSIEVYHEEKNANQIPKTQDKSDELENKQTVEYQYNEGFDQQTDGIDRSTPGGHGVFRVQPTPDYYKIQSTASSVAPEVRRPENSDYSDLNLQTFEDGPLPTGSAKTITHELYRPNSIRQSSGEVKYNSAGKLQVGSYEEVQKLSELPVSNPTVSAEISSSKEYSEEQFGIPSTPVTKPESQTGTPEITYSGEVSKTEVPLTSSPNFSGEEQTKGFLGSNEEYTSAFVQLSKHHQMTRPTDPPKSHYSSVHPTQQVSADFGTPVYQEQQSYELSTSSEKKSGAVPTQFPSRSPSEADFSQFNENFKTDYVSGAADIPGSPISPTAPGATQEFYTTGLSVNSQTQNSASINRQEDQRIGSFISVGNVHSTAESPQSEVQFFPSPTPSTFQVTVTESQKYPDYPKHVSSTQNSAVEVTEIPSAQTYMSESISEGVQTSEGNGQNAADGETDHELKLPNPSIVRVRTRGRTRSRGQVNFAASQSSTPAPYTRSKIEHKNNENAEQEQGTKTSHYQPVKTFKTNQYRGFKKPIRTTTESVTESEYKSNVYTIRPQRRPLNPSTVSTKRIRRPTSPLPSVESATEGFGMSTSEPHYQSEHSDFSPSGVSNDVYYEHSSFSPIRQKFRKFNEAGQKSDVINVHRPSSTAYSSATPTYSSVSQAEEQEDTSIVRNPEPVYEHSSLSSIRQKFRKFNDAGQKSGVFDVHRSTPSPTIYTSATPSYPAIPQSGTEEDTNGVKNPEPVYENPSLSPVRQKFKKFNEAGQKSDEINIHGSTPSSTIYPSDSSSLSVISEADVQEDTRRNPESVSVEVQEHSEKFPEWNPSESGFDVSGIVLTTIRTTSQEDQLEEEEPKKYQDSKKAFDPDLEKKSGRRRIRVRVHKRPHENFETAESQNLRTVANVLVPPTSTYKPNDETSFHQLAKNADFSFGGQKFVGSRSREYFRKRLNLTNAEEVNKGGENAEGENSESKATSSAKDGETQRNESYVQTNGANEETKISRPKFRGFVRKIIKHGHAIKEESKSNESSESEDANGKNENVDFHLRQQIRANYTGRFNGTRHKTLVRFVKKNKVRTHESEINQDFSSQEQPKEEKNPESHPVNVSETSSTESESGGVKEEKERVQETVQPTEAPETQHTQRSDAIQKKVTELTEQLKIRRFQLKTTQAPKLEETAEVSSEKPEEATPQTAQHGTAPTPQGGLFLTQRPKFYQTLRPLYYRPSQSGSQRTREYTSTTENTVKNTHEKKETPVRPKYGKTFGFGSQESGKQEEVKRYNEQQKNKNQHTQEVRKYLSTKSREGAFSQFSKNKYYTSQKIEKEVTNESQSKEKEEFTTPLNTKGSLADIGFSTNEETTESGLVRTESVEAELETTKNIEDSEIPTTTETVENSSEEEEEEEEESSEEQSSENGDVTESVKFEETTTEFKTELPSTIFQSSSEKAAEEIQTEKSENFDTQPDIYRFSKSSFSFDETEKFTGTKNRAHVRNITTDIIENTASFSAPGVDKQPEIRVVTRRLDEKLPTTTETQTDFTSIQKTEETTEELNTAETTTAIPETAQTRAVDPVTKAKLAKVLKTSTTTKISHETEICYKGKCIRTKSENPDEDLKKLVDSASIMKIEKTKT